MSSSIKPGAVIYAKDLACMARFYQELLGLQELEREPGHVVLESELVQLVIHAIPEQHAQGIHISVPPVLREEQAIKLCFTVGSIAVARQRAATLGGGLSPASQEWQVEGGVLAFRACNGFDPEGNVLQCREALRK